jgi:hypothetical protein
MKARRGVSLIEVLGVVSVLGTLCACGARMFYQRMTLGRDLVAYTRACALADQALELRRAGQDAHRLPARYPLRVLEEKYRDTPLTKVTVVVDWKGTHAERREVRLVSLMRR